MDKAPDFIILDETSYDVTQTCPVKIVSGKFSNIVYRYGKIMFQETPDGLNINMDIEMIDAPEGFDKTSREFTDVAGKIFVQIVENQVTTDPVDLEDDVHQDPVDNH